EKFETEGFVKQHDHIRFIDDVLYAITSGKILNTFSIQGNSPVFISKLDLESEENADISVNFTKERIYISDYSYSYYSTYQWSDMRTVNIENPLNPQISNDIKIPTMLDQLVFDNNNLIGIGKTQLNIYNERYNFGTITAFNISGVEKNSFILGKDYKRFTYEIRYDDQVLNLDRDLNRVFLPYSTYNPFDPEMDKNDHRLSIVNIGSDDIYEEVTFSLTRRPDRTLSISDNLAFSFSKNHINTLYKDSSWEKNEIFNGEVPSSIYVSRNFPYIVKKYIYSNKLRFVLVKDDSLDSSEYIDELIIKKSRTDYCIKDQVYFDNDRILIVSEPYGAYTDYSQCSYDENDSFFLSGYRITQSG
ncbi:MAG: hypothetical protein GY756_17090, partial [bacterium]|nr:hypothetical protein [bacterium]